MLRTSIIQSARKKLSVHLWFYIVVPTMLIFLGLFFLLTFSYNRITLRNSIQAADKETSFVAETVTTSYKELMMQFIKNTVSSNSKKFFQDIATCTEQQYVDVNHYYQEILTKYKNLSPLISSALFSQAGISSAGLLFYSYENGMLSKYASQEEKIPRPTSEAMSFFPAISDPFKKENYVIPFIFSLYAKGGKNYQVLLCDPNEQPTVYLYFFLSNEHINQLMSLYCNDKYEGTLLLFNENLQQITKVNAQPNFDLSYYNALSKAMKDKNSSFTWKSNYVFLHKIESSTLTLVNIVPKSLLTAKLQMLLNIIHIIAIICILYITVISLLISAVISRPLKKLMSSVNAIEHNRYHKKTVIKCDNEIGQLNDAIDSMYRTIQHQIETIRTTEKEKYNTRLQLLTEEINPHFLYNTLEFINMEVFNHHTQNASDMLSNLGIYLRTNLNYGSNYITFKEELNQVSAYITIMNYRFDHSIQFTSSVAPELLNMRIVKSIFQPLVENSLRHGFQINVISDFPIDPMIHIDIQMDSEYLTLSVIDNGAGIQIQKATDLLSSNSKVTADSKHVGLINIRERLESAYGSVKFTFSSIPYFENKVTIRILKESYVTFKE